VFKKKLNIAYWKLMASNYFKSVKNVGYFLTSLQ